MQQVQVMQSGLVKRSGQALLLAQVMQSDLGIHSGQFKFSHDFYAFWGC